MAEDLTASSFADHEGSTFTVHLDDDTVELELDHVTEHDHPDQESFSVLFRGPKSDSLQQHGMYRVVHDELGEYELFLGPVVTGKESDGDQHYEVAFSRMKEDE